MTPRLQLSPPAPSPSKSSSAPLRPAPGKSTKPKRDIGTMLKQTLEDKTQIRGSIALKRHKAEIYIKREGIAMKERVVK